MPNKGWYSEWLQGAQTGSNNAGTFAGLNGVEDYENRKAQERFEQEQRERARLEAERERQRHQNSGF